MLPRFDWHPWRSRRVAKRRYIADCDGYAIDHLIAVELGGSNSVRNLWPQRFEDADKKGRLENHRSQLRIQTTRLYGLYSSHVRLQANSAKKLSTLPVAR
jgi:hypothetical protein